MRVWIIVYMGDCWYDAESGITGVYTNEEAAKAAFEKLPQAANSVYRIFDLPLEKYANVELNDQLICIGNEKSKSIE